MFFSSKNHRIWKAKKAKRQIWPVLLGSRFVVFQRMMIWLEDLDATQSKCLDFHPGRHRFFYVISEYNISFILFSNIPFKTFSQPWVLAFEWVQCLTVGIWNIKARNFWFFTRARRLRCENGAIWPGSWGPKSRGFCEESRGMTWFLFLRQNASKCTDLYNSKMLVWFEHDDIHKDRTTCSRFKSLILKCEGWNFN